MKRPRPVEMIFASALVGNLVDRRLMLTVLGGLADFERDLIAAPHGRRPGACEAIKRRDEGEETCAEIARAATTSTRARFPGQLGSPYAPLTAGTRLAGGGRWIRTIVPRETTNL